MNCVDYTENLSKIQSGFGSLDESLEFGRGQDAVSAKKSIKAIIDILPFINHFRWQYAISTSKKVTSCSMGEYYRDYVTSVEVRRPLAMSPDGRYLAYFESRHNLVIEDLAHGTSQLLNNISLTTGDIVFDMAYSDPIQFIDDDRLLICMVPEDKPEEMHWLGFLISEFENRLGSGALKSDQTITDFCKNMPNEATFAKSSDGRLMAITQEQIIIQEKGKIRRQKIDLPEQPCLVAMSPCSEMIFVQGVDDGFFGIDLKDGKVTEIAYEIRGFVINEKNKKLYFIQFEIVEDPTKSICCLDLETGEREKLVGLPQQSNQMSGNFLKISPDGQALLTDISEPDGHKILAFAIQGDGKLVNPWRIPLSNTPIREIGISNNDQATFIDERGEIWKIGEKESE